VTTGVRSGLIGDCNKRVYRHTMEMEQMMALLLAEIRKTERKYETVT
jgi:hypothetical protein